MRFPGAQLGLLRSSSLTVPRGVGVAMLAGCVDLDDHRHSRSQSLCRFLVVVNENLDWYALHDLGEVAGRVVRREQGKLRPAGRGDLFDMAVQPEAGKCINGDHRRIALGYVGELGLLIVSLNPYIALHERDHLCARADELPHADFAFSYDTVCRSENSRVFQVRVGYLDRLFLRPQVSLEL